MTTVEANKRVTIDFPSELYRTIKSFTAFYDLSIRDFVLKAVSHELRENNIKIPNKETLQTFKKTDSGKELHSYKSFDALLLDLKKNKKIK